jgi:predicted aspartyl protease
MNFPYDTDYQPEFPALKITLSNDDEGDRTSLLIALVDTGSDGTLVPLTYLKQIAAPALTDTRLRSHWGEWRNAQLFLVDIELDGLKLPGVFVVGDEIGNQVILGRNVLNKLRVLLDGPEKVVEILTQRGKRAHL